MQIEKNSQYGESNIAVIGITKIYGRPQLILINSDLGKTPDLKFVGSRFRSPTSKYQTLEDMAEDRFIEQTGLDVEKMLGLRAIIPSRSRHGVWNFRNVFLALTNGNKIKQSDGRNVYVADLEQLSSFDEFYAHEIGKSGTREKYKWASKENQAISEIAKNIIYNFDWERFETTSYKNIPCFGVEPQTTDSNRRLGCGLSVASSVILYKPDPDNPLKVILLKRKQDKYPGYVGGKIETPEFNNMNLDPISCCLKECEEELGFPITARGLIGVAHTATDMPKDKEYYSGISTYSFIAEPLNQQQATHCLKNPKDFLEEKMECYVIENIYEHKDRILEKQMRMPDNIPIGEAFFKIIYSPGKAIPLTQIVSSGMN